ncbi:adenylate/guanylate cyclase with TPR repeats [Caldithrix abyssi DSM 13497]|uniref:Adenylate cyclase n=1 Tax=Caldithrix abyssi DSM 13497 TaxID=880073 RepID=H1XU10_CALAY|nr:CHASE2 domain-containing protein [Caldithrix abyssi]APF16898.1 adenylate cyclase [Caldithrix abyssi DSM 13497]EHO40453.1 adenylate/guanylate cyclase with TPR repeats [Caldithrix abyssi DSM 13497]
MKIQKPEPKKSIIFLLFFLSLSGAYLLSHTSVFQTLELKFLDLKFQLRGALPIENSSVIILAIDDQSDLSTPHRWPWPRSYFAHVIENLEKAGAAVIGVDVIFDQPDVSNPQSDDSLAHVLKRYPNVVLAGKLQHRRGRISTIEVLPPYHKFTEANNNWGLVSLEADVDGFYRRYPLVARVQDSLLPSFAAKIIQLYLQTETEIKDLDSEVWIGDIAVPKYDSRNMLINYYGPPFHYPYVSFDNVLDDQEVDLVEEYDVDAFDDPGDSTLGIPPGLLYSGELKDKIVLIGSTMPELHDNFPTPFLQEAFSGAEKARVEMPGVEIHANAIQSILDRNFIDVANPWFMFVLNICLALLILISVQKKATLLNLFLFFLLSVAYGLISILFFTKGHLLIPITTPVLVILFSFISQISYQYILSQQEKRMLRGVFSHYVPEKLIQEIIAHPEKLALGGEEREVTVLFSDIAGFTTLSEHMKPAELVTQLNEYLTAMTNVILRHDGIIDKFEGDAIMAEFGVPVHFEGHQKAACLAALEMQQELKKLNRKWQQAHKPLFEVRIGINTGIVIVGNMGSEKVFDYTVIGDHVNLGARLEGANKAYKTKIMVSNFTYEAVKEDFIFRPLDLIRVKGKTKPVQVYELIGSRQTPYTDQFMEMLDLFNQGLVAYRLQQWDLAREFFEQCLRLVPNDGPSQLYVERCQFFALNPPEPDWDGVWDFKVK